MTDANWAFIIVLFACFLALAAFVCWVRETDRNMRVTEDLALADDAATFNEPTRADDQPGLITFDAPTLAEAFGWLDEKTETWLFPACEFIEGDFYLWTCELREGA